MPATADLLQRVEHLAEAGRPAHDWPAEIGTPAAAIAQALTDTGRRDLAKRIRAVANAEQRARDLIEDVEWLVNNSVPARDWPAAMGKSAQAIARALWRAKRPDLARRIERVVQNERPRLKADAPCPGCGGDVNRGSTWCSSKCFLLSRAGSEAQSAKSRWAMHRRWHTNRGMYQEACDFCISEVKQRKFAS